jgi:hypothetical protein
VSGRGSRARRRSVVLVAALAVTGCAGPTYELRGASATASGAPVKAEVPRVECWRNCDLTVPVSVELDLRNDDAARTFTTALPRLTARSLWGGPTFELPLVEIDGVSPKRAARPSLSPASTRRLRLTFASDGEPPEGPYRLALVEGVDGLGSFEVPLSDPPAGPRWGSSRPPNGVYLHTGFAGMGSRDRGFFVMEPIGGSLRFSFGRLVLGVDLRYSFLFRSAPGVGGSSFGGSGLVSVAWQPWTWRLAPYAEGGGYGGVGDSPRPHQGRFVSSPRASAGILWFFGPRVGSRTDIPIDRPLSSQRVGGLRVAYAHWFQTEEGGGSDGLEMSLELGWAR